MLALFVLAFIVRSTVSEFECGLPNNEPLSSRVVGGRRETFFKYPWFASIHVPYEMHQQTCAGALIAPQFVLTAGHCFNVKSFLPKKSFYHVTLGIFNQCEDTPGAITYSTTDVYVHEKFTVPEHFYDIALLKLNATSALMPVCLPPKGTPIKHVEKAEILGFGRLVSELSKEPCEINEATVEIFTMAQCRKQSEIPPEVLDDMDELKSSFCAGIMKGGVDTCQGDSGGSLLVVKYKRYFSRGIVSFGYGCGSENLPGVYTDVASYIDWINNTMGGELEIYQPPPSKKKPRRNVVENMLGLVSGLIRG